MPSIHIRIIAEKRAPKFSATGPTTSMSTGNLLIGLPLFRCSECRACAAVDDRS